MIVGMGQVICHIEALFVVSLMTLNNYQKISC